MSLSGARKPGCNTPYATRMTPKSAKNHPEGMRKSSMHLPEPDIQQNEQHRDDDCQRARTLEPRYAFIVRYLRQPGHQSLKLPFRLRPGRETHRDRNHKSGGPCEDRNPEILRHCRGEPVDLRQP